MGQEEWKKFCVELKDNEFNQYCVRKLVLKSTALRKLTANEPGDILEERIVHQFISPKGEFIPVNDDGNPLNDEFNEEPRRKLVQDCQTAIQLQIMFMKVNIEKVKDKGLGMFVMKLGFTPSFVTKDQQLRIGMASPGMALKFPRTPIVSATTQVHDKASRELPPEYSQILSGLAKDELKKRAVLKGTNINFQGMPEKAIQEVYADIVKLLKLEAKPRAEQKKLQRGATVSEKTKNDDYARDLEYYLDKVADIGMNRLIQGFVAEHDRKEGKDPDMPASSDDDYTGWGLPVSTHMPEMNEKEEDKKAKNKPK